ncbi:DUF997 family protein [Gemella sp. GH3]|uniref:DUF997 family protein n=1 Tax=unclassified Gemella TaxID=2624949 RepID=UPI0015D085DC|nr:MULTISPECIES: DUF997 family protein [unclassified Gemella]MBF0714322.1 DUF997 family protein [Gemella sp. GH3.1]NYS51274.1 DUF997 family protein [Gemella sp. GH3]
MKNKDYIYAIFLVITHFALWYYFAYIKYKNIAVEDYKYILGMPEWFFYSAIVVSIFIILLLIIICNIIFNEDIEIEEERRLNKDE